MARLARIVVSGRAHHVIQRGNRREPRFLEEGDQSISLGKSKPYAYRKASNVVTVSLLNGIVSTSHYDQLNRLTSLTSQVSSYTYQLSPTGNRTGSSELNGRTLTWNYNGVYQLTEQTVASDPAGIDGSATYGLDPVGNRLSTSSTISGILNGTDAYNPDDEVGSETYDRNGNVLTEGGKGFTYDSENRLTTMNGGAVAIVYDGDGNRVAETVGGVTTRYLVDDLNPTGYAQVIDEVISGVAVRGYALGLQRIDENQPINGTWTPSFYGYDGGGTVRQLTNLTGSVTDTYEYDAFGYLLTSTGTTPNNYLYRGEQYDPNLSLYYLRARYYNPATGRFMSRDPEDGKPVDPGTLHKYLYASGDPINRADPTGRYSTAGTIPGQVGFGDAVGEYVVLVLQATAAVVAVETLSCAVNTAYAWIAASAVADANITKGNCTAGGKGRMHIQLQYKTTITVKVPITLENDDPPGVTLSQVGAALNALYTASLYGVLGPFPKSLNYELVDAIKDVSVCASEITLNGGTLPRQNVCQGYVGNSGWRIDLDADAGYNLTR